MAMADVTMVPGEHNDYANALLGRARELDDEKRELLEQIGANRDSLRLLRTQRLMSPEQTDAVEAFYPTRKRKTAKTAKTDKQ